MSLPAVVWRRGGSPAAGFLAPGGSRHAFCSSAGWLAAALRNSGRAPSADAALFGGYWWLAHFSHFYHSQNIDIQRHCKTLYRDTNP